MFIIRFLFRPLFNIVDIPLMGVIMAYFHPELFNEEVFKNLSEWEIGWRALLVLLLCSSISSGIWILVKPRNEK